MKGLYSNFATDIKALMGQLPYWLVSGRDTFPDNRTNLRAAYKNKHMSVDAITDIIYDLGIPCSNLIGVKFLVIPTYRQQRVHLQTSVDLKFSQRMSAIYQQFPENALVDTSTMEQVCIINPAEPRAVFESLARHLILRQKKFNSQSSEYRVSRFLDIIPYEIQRGTGTSTRLLFRERIFKNGQKEIARTYPVRGFIIPKEKLTEDVIYKAFFECEYPKGISAHYLRVHALGIEPSDFLITLGVPVGRKLYESLDRQQKEAIFPARVTVGDDYVINSGGVFRGDVYNITKDYLVTSQEEYDKVSAVCKLSELCE